MMAGSVAHYINQITNAAEVIIIGSFNAIIIARVAMSKGTKQTYHGPCMIPNSVQKLAFVVSELSLLMFCDQNLT